MASMYGGQRWASAYSALPVGATGELTLAADMWARALIGIAPEQIADGLAACLASCDEYVPTPQLFRARCLGVPDLSTVRWQLRTSADPTPFLRLVLHFLDWYAYRTESSREAERLVADAYGLAREHVMRGGAYLPEPVAAIEVQPEVRTPASEETVRKLCDRIRRRLGLPLSPDGTGEPDGVAAGHGSSPEG